MSLFWSNILFFEEFLLFDFLFEWYRYLPLFSFSLVVDNFLLSIHPYELDIV